MLSEANANSVTDYLLQTVYSMGVSMIPHSFLDCSYKQLGWLQNASQFPGLHITMLLPKQALFLSQLAPDSAEPVEEPL